MSVQKAVGEQEEVCMSDIDPFRASLVECLQAQRVLTTNEDDEGDILKLTGLGKQCVKVCVPVHSPCRAASTREGVLA